MIRRVAWICPQCSWRNNYMRHPTAAKRTARTPEDQRPEAQTTEVQSASRTRLFLLHVAAFLTLCGNSGSVAWGQTPSAVDPPPKGALLIAGGGLRYDNAEVWSRFVKLAGE